MRKALETKGGRGVEIHGRLSPLTARRAFKRPRTWTMRVFKG